MNELVESLRQWILAQGIDGCDMQETRTGNITLASERAKGEVNFHSINDSTVVEMRVERMVDGESQFFLHFELVDLARAQELFDEMASVIIEMEKRQSHHVLLCCSCGITTTFFSNKLNECALQMSLGMDFCAMPLAEAKRAGTAFDAVLLAPQVGHQRKEVVQALPDTLVMELPARIFGAYDAPAALRLVTDALAGARTAAAGDLRMVRSFDHTKRVLAVSYVHREDEPTLAYRVLDCGRETLAGMLVRRHFDTHVLNDLAATLRVSGYAPESFDAVGIAIPDIVDEGAIIRQRDSELARFDLAGTLRDKWGVPVYVDNVATAAAAGCYVGQEDYNLVAFHAQTVGVAACDEGYVFDGNPVYGRGGFSGSLRYLAQHFSLSMDLEDAAWRYDGTRELVARYVETTICTLAPEAVFVWADLLPDMNELRRELEKTLPPEAIPALIEVSDYDGLTLAGELALCLQRIAKKHEEEHHGVQSTVASLPR